jgi:hypothetical protein
MEERTEDQDYGKQYIHIRCNLEDAVEYEDICKFDLPGFKGL